MHRERRLRCRGCRDHLFLQRCTASHSLTSLTMNHFRRGEGGAQALLRPSDRTTSPVTCRTSRADKTLSPYLTHRESVDLQQIVHAHNIRSQKPITAHARPIVLAVAQCTTKTRFVCGLCYTYNIFDTPGHTAYGRTSRTPRRRLRVNPPPATKIVRTRQCGRANRLRWLDPTIFRLREPMRQKKRQ